MSEVPGLPLPVAGGSPLPPETVEHLRLLALFHKIVAAMAFCFSMVPMIYVTLGAALLLGALKGGKDAPPQFVGCLFLALGLTAVTTGVTYSICLFQASRFLEQRRRYTFCVVMAGLSTLFTPMGTILGIFTLMVLVKPEVKATFT
jgi:hypothetical protein